MKRMTFVVALLAPSSPALADILDVGTCVQRGGKGMTMIVEAAGPARKITYRVKGADGKFDPRFTSSILVTFDGKESPLLGPDGKPTAATMAVRKIDAYHTETVLRMNGKQYGISRAELSKDGKVLTSTDDSEPGGAGMPGKHTNTWDCVR